MKVSKEELKRLPHKLQVQFALFCAKRVNHLVNDENRKYADACIDVVERWLEDKATATECNRVVTTAYYAVKSAGGAAEAATDATTYVVDAVAVAAVVAVAAGAVAVAAGAVAATYAAAYTADTTDAAYVDRWNEIEVQRKYYEELLTFVDGTVDALLISGE